MIAIWKRELQSYFYTATAYVYMGIFMLLTSVMFYMQILQQRSSDLLTFIGQMSYLWMLLSPILTMRLLSEERQKRTDQLLLTSPISVSGIVLGKYLAAVTVAICTALLSLAFVLIIAIYGAVYPGEMFVGYLGFLLQGCAFVAIDLYFSGLTKTPVTAAILAFGVNFALWIMDLLAASVTSSTAAQCLNFISLYDRNEPFLMGQLSFASVCFDLSLIAAFLALTIHGLDSRRYRGN